MELNRWLGFLLSDVYAGALARDHREDCAASGLTDATIRTQRIRSVPPDMIDPLLGFPTPKVVSAYLLPFPDLRGGWLSHVRLKIFPALTTERGTIRYLQPRRSGARIYFPLATL